MLADKPTELPRIKLTLELDSPSLWSASIQPTWPYCQVHTYINTYIHTCLLLLISMLWHRQAIFKSKGDKLCSSAECRIWTQGPRHQIASRLNARWQTDWAIEDQAKNLNSTARPYDQRAFSPLDPTVSWLSHLALAIYIFVVVNFTGKQYSNRKETSCFPLLNEGFEPGIPDTKSPADWMLADKPTELPRIKLTLELDSPSLWSASIQPTWPYCQVHTYINTYIHTCLLLLISMLWHRQAIFKSKGDNLCSSAECRIWTRDPRHQIASRLNARWQTDWVTEDQANTWTRQPVPMISEHSAHLAPLSVTYKHKYIHVCCC